jgi:hypothetical protein
VDVVTVMQPTIEQADRHAGAHGPAEPDARHWVMALAPYREPRLARSLVELAVTALPPPGGARGGLPRTPVGGDSSSPFAESAGPAAFNRSDPKFRQIGARLGEWRSSRRHV